MQKIYVEEGTNYRYIFLKEKLSDSFEAYLKKNSLKKNNLYKDLADKLHISDETVRKHINKKNSPGSLEEIYQYGIFFEGDRYAFLLLRETEEEFYEKADVILRYKEFAKVCVQAVRSNLVKILQEYAASDCFNSKDIEKDIFLYYRDKVDEVENLIYQIHGHHELVRELFQITSEFKQFVCSYSIPGVPESWYEINRNLQFYTWEYHILDESPELFEKMMKFSGKWPTESEILNYREYFKKLQEDSIANNYHYSENDFYQRELIKTIDLIFMKRIEEVFNI